MLLHFNANRLRLRLQKEKAALARRLGRQRLAHEKAVAKAQFACDYLRRAGEVLASQSLPAVWDLQLAPENSSQPGEVNVYMLLDGIYIGRFKLYPDWLIPYWVGEKVYFFFWRALRAASRYMARQVACYQLLRHRAEPFSEWLRAEAKRLGQAKLMDLSLYYYCAQEWNLESNHVYLRWTRDRTRFELCVYGDRFTFGIADKAPQRHLMSEEEVIELLRQELAR